MATATQQLADLVLGRPVVDVIADYRKAGLSWRKSAQQLARDTEGRVDVTQETVRAWWLARDNTPDVPFASSA